jgi:8-oxo-dGTP pyrophosphatase MutT (NUDIX family)
MTVDARFCPRCSASLSHVPPVACGACGYALWVNPRPTGTVIIVNDSRFLALKRARPPRAGWWDLPGGFCEGWELPADAAVREAREELGVGVRLDTFVGMYIGRYQYQEELLPILDCFWLASIVDGEIRLDPEEGTEFDWLPLRHPPPMAFETMDLALAEAVSCLDSSSPGN